MVETMGSGGGLFDYDGDGDLDVYLVNGAPLPGSASPSPAPGNALFRNDGEGGFVDVTRDAGVGDASYGMGMTAGDVDNDGDIDLYVTNFGENVFYRNNGDGTFSDWTDGAGLAAGGWSASAAFADYDGDGVPRSLRRSLRRLRSRQPQVLRQPGEGHQRLLPSRRLRARARASSSAARVTAPSRTSPRRPGFSFPGRERASVSSGATTTTTVTSISTWPTTRCGTSSFGTRAGSRFSDVTLLAGVGYSEDGRTQAGMGTDMADYDGDGRLDLTVTNLDFEYNAVYRAGELGGFTDVSYEAGIAETSLNFVGFGTLFFDYDDDGDLDLFVANGHIIDNIALFGAVSTYAEPNFLFENRGNGSFEEVASRVAPVLAAPNVARGAAAGDVDGDGDLDLLVTRCGGPALLARNEVGSALELARTAPRGTPLEPRRRRRPGHGARFRPVLGEGSEDGVELPLPGTARRALRARRPRWSGRDRGPLARGRRRSPRRARGGTSSRRGGPSEAAMTSAC